DLVPSLLAASDVLGTGWFAAVAAEVGPGTSVAVVGDGAVGLMGVLAAKQLGAETIIAMSRHEDRQQLAREFGATHVIAERGEAGVAKVKELTGGLGAHSVIEAVGTQESMMQAIRSTRPGGHVGYVGVSHDVQLPGDELFFSLVHLHGGPAPVRRFLPELIDLVWDRTIEPGKVFDRTLPLEQAAEAYAAKDQHKAIKLLLQPGPSEPPAPTRPTARPWTDRTQAPMPALNDLLTALDAGHTIPGGSPLHEVMHRISQGALRITGELNGGYHDQ